MSTTHVVAAIFPDRESAVATRETLGHEHYHFRWLAVTKPADEEAHAHERAHDPDAVVPEVHAIAEGSDGAVGAFGRFLSGAGSSLRKALEDHGVSETDAEAIDAATAPHGAVLVVHAPLERVADAATLLEQGGGRVFTGGEVAMPSGATATDATLAAGAAGAGAASYASPTLGHDTLPPSADTAGVSNTIGTATDPLGTTHGTDAYDRTATGGDGVGTVSDTTMIEVPIEREEVFIERRPSTPPLP